MSSRKQTHASSLVQTLSINVLYFLSQVSSIKSNIKSLETKITECTENERKALAECKTLQEAVKNANALESSLGEKYNHIKELESKVCSCLTLMSDVSGSGPIHKDSLNFVYICLQSKQLLSFTNCFFFTFLNGQQANQWREVSVLIVHTIKPLFSKLVTMENVFDCFTQCPRT